MALAPSSPRLPSPPPAVEIQIGPHSPFEDASVALATTEIEQSHLDDNSRRRIHPGTQSCEMAAGPPLVPLNELDSPFQLQEHLAALHYHHTNSATQALTRAAALHLSQPPPGIDRTLWLYELCRFLISQCNSLIVGFLFDTPPCSANTCPEMRASEWQFLCAVHEQPKSCCAIDYCCHTLDWAANVVSDQRIFPSRFVVVNDAHSKNVGIKSLVNVFRRLHRIFAHAWFQHRSVFWTVEGQTGLYVFFKTVCDLYDLLPAENYKLPPEAEGLEAAPPEEPEVEKPPTILKPSRGNGAEDENVHPSVGRTNTRRHIRSSPSTGSAVTTVPESDEEEAGGVSRRMKSMHLSPPDTVQEEDADNAEVADVTVIVEPGNYAEPELHHSQTPLESTTNESEQSQEADSNAESKTLEPHAAVSSESSTEFANSADNDEVKPEETTDETSGITDVEEPENQDEQPNVTLETHQDEPHTSLELSTPTDQAEDAPTEEEPTEEKPNTTEDKSESEPDPSTEEDS